MDTAHSSNSSHKTLWSGVLEHSKITRVFALEYRLAFAPPFNVSRNPFPAALIDSIAEYLYLVQDVGFNLSNIIINGDSAGGVRKGSPFTYSFSPDSQPFIHLCLSTYIDVVEPHLSGIRDYEPRKDECNDSCFNSRWM